MAGRDELLDNITTKLRTLFPDGADDAEEKRAEVLAYAAEEALRLPRVRDVAAVGELRIETLRRSEMEVKKRTRLRTRRAAALPPVAAIPARNPLAHFAPRVGTAFNGFRYPCTPGPLGALGSAKPLLTESDEERVGAADSYRYY